MRHTRIYLCSILNLVFRNYYMHFLYFSLIPVSCILCKVVSLVARAQLHR